MKNRGKLIVITGPSGAGKGTVLSRVLTSNPEIFLSISATTRAPRDGEIHGVNYYFLAKEDFENKISENEFLEYAQYVDNYYGTLKAPVEDKLSQGINVILEIEVQGAMSVKASMPEALLVFISPPSFEELEKRLRGRGTENEDKILKRLETAKVELASLDKFDHNVVNDNIEDTIDAVLEIINKD